MRTLTYLTHEYFATTLLKKTYGSRTYPVEHPTPTIARVVPAKNDLAPGQLLGYEPFSKRS